MAVENRISFLAEFSPLINSINIYVYLRDEKFIDVGVQQKSILIKCRKEILEYAMDKSISLIPSSQRGIEVTSDNFIVFQAQAEKKSLIINSVLSSLVSDLQALRLTSLSVKLKDMKCLHIKCKICDNNLSKEIALRRACALPFEDFYSAAENWFCHHHKDSKVKKYNILPDEEELFYSDFQFWINFANISSTVEGGKVICSRCKLVVGTRTNDLAQLWVNDVKVESENGTTITRDTHEILGSFIDSLEQQNLSGNIHLVLEQEGEKKYLSVIVVDCNHTVIVCDNVHTGSNFKNTFNGEVSPRILKKRSCYKVLYSLGATEKKCWSQQLTTQVISCNQRFFASVYSSLQSSTQFLPQQLRTVDNPEAENVGFIFRE